MIVATVPDFSKELELNEAINCSNHSPAALAQPNRERSKGWIAATRPTIIAVDESGRDLLLGAVQFVRQGGHLESDEDIVLMERHSGPERPTTVVSVARRIFKKSSVGNHAL